MDTIDIQSAQAAALALRQAYGLRPIQPISDRLIPNTADAGYAVQNINTLYWLDSGRKIAGVKIGLTSAAVQAQIGVTEPDFGILFADMEIANGATVDIADLLQPRIEGEIAFCMNETLNSTDLTVLDIAKATAWVAPALEIVASRIDGWRCSIADTVADNASAGRYVLGAPCILPDWSVLSQAKMSMRANGSAVSSGIGSASMGDPFNAMLWVATRFAKLGRPLNKGDIVLSGALGPLIWIEPDTRYQLEIQGVGEVSVQFTSMKETS